MKNMKMPLVHPKTKDAANDFLRQPVGPLLVLGAPGSGKSGLAYAVAAAALGIESEAELKKYPYFHIIAKPGDKQEIPIEAIRELGSRLRLKIPGRKEIRRVVLIDDAQNLSGEAQNALLKMLEEPDDTTLFIMTALNKQSLLPTIVSRTRQLPVHPVSASQAEKFFSPDFDAKQIESAWSLSRGGSSLIEALLSEGKQHPLKMSIVPAKEFLGQTRYQRILYLDRLSKDKGDLKLFLEALERILAVLYRKALENDRQAPAKKIIKDRRTIFGCRRALELNANPRLLVLHLLLKLNI